MPLSGESLTLPEQIDRARSKRSSAIYRKIEVKLNAWKDAPDRKPLLLKGARQVGKTFVLKKWGAESFEKVHYINFEENQKAAAVFDEDLHVPRILNELGFLLKTKIEINEKTLLILDEIQLAPKALTSLKYFCENARGLAVCAAGSLLGVILSSESFPVGKVNFLYMYPMTFNEFIQASDERESWRFISEPSTHAKIPAIVHDHLWNLAKLYYIVGGMPEVVACFVEHRHDLQSAFVKVREAQKELFKGYESDFAKHAGKLNATHIHALYRSIASQLSSQIDNASKRFCFADIMEGKKGFSIWQRPLHWLINAGLALQVKIAKSASFPLEHFTQDNMFKLYMHDVGLLGCAQNLDAGTIMLQDYGLAKGYFAENFVAQELRAHEEIFDTPLYSWCEGTAEIEFIRQKANSFLPIEVKAGHRTKAKSLGQFMARYQPPLAIKISARELQYNQSTRLLQLPLYLASWAAIL